MTRVLGIGECMIEMAPAGDGHYAMGIAGDTFNTCWYLRQVGDPGLSVGYLSAVGQDDVSARMEAFMREAGIDPILARRADRTVGLYLISLNEGERSFSYWRANSAARTLADDLEALPGLGSGDLAYFSGITLAILPPEGRLRLHAALARARAEGVRVVFDPNIRPALWETAETLRAEITKAAAAADVVLPSFSDEAAAFGDATPEAVAARYRAAGAELVVVKNGDDTVAVRGADMSLEIAPEPVAEVVDTTAAGDAFNAGFLAALLRGTDLSAACRAGCRLARQVIGQRGALVAVDEMDLGEAAGR